MGIGVQKGLQTNGKKILINYAEVKWLEHCVHIENPVQTVSTSSKYIELC